MSKKPYKLTDVIANEICERISKGENVTDICKDVHMPDIAYFWKWKRENHELAENVRLAMQDKGQHVVESLDEIENAVLAGKLDSASANVILTNRRWKAGKFYPKMYGDKQIIESNNVNKNYDIEVPLTSIDQQILSDLGFSVDMKE